MAIYVIGDIQGCYDPLQRLLQKIAFDPSNDQLWFAGDLVSRGKQSLQTLRFIKSLGDAAITVLGNHDISLLAAAHGVFKPHKSLQELMDATDAPALLQWLQQQPLLHHSPELNAVMVHAGLSPHWDLATAKACALELEQCLRQPEPAEWLATVYGDLPDQWLGEDFIHATDRQRYSLNVLTRMRYCYADGRLEFRQKLDPVTVNQSHPQLRPWYSLLKSTKINETIFFGHWSTLGYYHNQQLVSLDSGCVWGGALTAVRIDTNKMMNYQVACEEYG